MSKLTFIFLLTSFSLCCGYKLLLVFPFPSLSHSILGQGYVRNLLKAGHEVTYITPYPMKNATKGLRQIEVMNNTNIFSDSSSNKKRVDMDNLETILDITMKISNATLMHKNVQKLLNDVKEEFDAVIVEWMYSEIYAGFSSVFKCPLIWSSPFEPNSFVLMLLNDYSMSRGLTSSSTQQRNFWSRVVEQYRYLHFTFSRWILSGKEKSVFNRAFGPATAKRGGILPPFEVVKYNGSLVLGNSHFSTGQTFRLPLNYVQIAGYHIDERELLPKNLQKIMDVSKKGVVYFSLGSMFRGYPLSNNIETTILDIFGKINQTVIWKHDKPLKTPNNVHVFSNIQQQSVLAHPNCTLFISNVERLSIIEAIHFGIPYIGISISGEKINNVETVVKRGFGKKVDFLDITSLKAAIDEVLRNAKYGENAKTISAIYHDRPITAGKELVFWVEHVIRTKGALHLRFPILSPWYNTVYFEFMIVGLIPVACLSVLSYILLTRKKDQDLSLKKYI